MPRVGIIGAGVSGLSVAARLQRLGHHCTVFEKSRGLGGRLARRHLPWGHIDIGAPFLSPGQGDAQDPLAQFCRAGLLIKGRLRRALLAADTLHQASPVDAYWAPNNNNEICHALADNLTVIRQRRIAAIEYTPQGVELTDDQGQPSAPFDVVVISAPAQQTQALLPESSKLHQQPFPHMVPGWTVTLQFTAPLGLFAHHQIIDFASNHPLARGVDMAALRQGSPRHCYQFQLGAALSRQCQALPQAQSVDRVLAVLAQLGHLPALRQHTVQTWNLCAPGHHRGAIDIVDPDQRLVLCGDWSSEGSGVGAALISAERATRAVIALLATQPEPTRPLCSL